MQLRNDRPPLTARSVLASTLLGTEPPELPVRVLVRAGELFGIPEGTTRVALSRMVRSGELTASDGRYRLAGALLERHGRQHESRSGTPSRPWTGERWSVVVVTADRRRPSERADLRAALRRLRFGELREGTWLRPDNLGHTDIPPALAAACTRFSATDVDPAVVDRLWDLPRWASLAEELRSEMAPLLDPLRNGDTDALAPGFVTSAAVLRHLQADPLLPPTLLPSDWPGDRLRRDYDDFDGAYRDLLRRWFAGSLGSGR